MASTINADNGVVSGSSGVKTTADTSGVLALQSNGSTGVTLNTDLSVTFAGAITSTLATTGAITATGSNNDAISAYIENSNQTGAGAADRRLTLLAAGNTSYFGVSIWQNRAVVEGNSPSGMAIGANATSAPLVFYAGSRTEGMRLTSTGLGIGTSSPSTKLAVAGGISGTAGANISGAGWGVLPYVANSLVLDNNAGESRFFATGADATTDGSFLFYTGQTDGGANERFRIGTSGQLGIGGANYGTSGQVLTSGGSGAAPTWATPAGVSVFTGSFTRDLTTASGSQAITGVGFVPKAVWFTMSVGGGARFSDGFDTQTARGSTYTNGSATFNADTRSIVALTDGSNFYYAQIASMDASGFTLTWTKTGAPTGTATIKYLAIG